MNVGLTMVLGTLIALLLKELGPLMRIVVTTALVLAWAMPVVVAAQLWLWMTNYENGVLNYVLTKLGFGDFQPVRLVREPVRRASAVITSLIVWGAVPFVAITIYAGLTQVPGELLEAAEIDGSGAFKRFRDVTFPILKPIFVILTSLSIIWDFQVFTQPFLLRQQRPDPDYWLMSIYAYEKSFGISQYGLGSAIALVMLADDALRHVLLHPPDDPDRGGAMSARRGGAGAERTARRTLRRVALNLAGLVVFVVMVFPVYWMVATAFKPGLGDHELHAAAGSRTTRRSSTSPTRSTRPCFWTRPAEQRDRRRRSSSRSRSRSRSSPRSRSRSTASPAEARLHRAGDR